MELLRRRRGTGVRRDAEVGSRLVSKAKVVRCTDGRGELAVSVSTGLTGVTLAVPWQIPCEPIVRYDRNKIGTLGRTVAYGMINSR